ncbi:MAG TPA: carbon storage regulator [Opitutae bacterium]|nr:carbon storage regulator [Opitutae bacterium]
MLVLTRNAGESIIIILPDTQTIEIRVNTVSGKQVKLGVIAPKDFKIYRREAYDASSN